MQTRETCGRAGEVIELERWGRRLQKEQKGGDAWEEQELATDRAGGGAERVASSVRHCWRPSAHPGHPASRNLYLPPRVLSVGSGGGYTPDLYSRKSEYTEKAPSTGPFL